MKIERNMSLPFFEQVTILGVGLIGASIALALKKYGLCRKIKGWGRTEENLEKARKKTIIDSYNLDPAVVCENSDLIIFAIPVGSFIETAKRIRKSLKQGAIITDVGSVKGKLVYDLEELMPEGTSFVGAHPITGSNLSGIDNANGDIFHGAKCIITPTEHTHKDALQKVIAIWEKFGSIVKLTSPLEHDKIYASVSHLPHLIAYVIVNTVADIDKSFLNYSGQGFKDFTRIATSSPELWRDICIHNKDYLLETLKIFKKNIERVSRYLIDCDSISLEKDFMKARILREGIGKN